MRDSIIAMTSKKTYRHDVTGKVGEFDPRVALADRHLVEIESGTKPLAYTPINKEAVESYHASKSTPEEPAKPGNKGTKEKE